MAEKKSTKSFILRVDSDTMDAIEAWAADEFRSTNGQLQWIITEALRKAKRLPKKKKESKNEEKMMNRKKALVILFGLQSMLLALLIALFTSNVISFTVFVPLIIFVGVVFSALTVVAVRKLPLE